MRGCGRRGASSAARRFTLAAGAALVACGPPTSGKPVGELWREQCSQCHAEDGRGLPAWRGLAPRVDLTASELVREDARGLVFQRIAYGYGSMPGFGHKLERGDLELLTQFVFDLQAPAPGGR